MSKATKLGLKEFRINMGLFEFDVICVVGNHGAAAKYVDWKFEDRDAFDDEWLDKGYQARGRCYFKTGYVPIIWIPHKPKTPREHATLAHECIHAVMHLFNWAGIDVNRNTEEVLTHSTAHLINGILTGLNKKPKAQSTKEDLGDKDG